MSLVLLIEAEEAFGAPLAEAIGSWGYDVSWSRDGKDGFERALKEKPSAIVLCLELPRLSGYSLCNKLRKEESLKHVPIVAVSGEASDDQIAQQKKLPTHADAYVKKPFQPDSLKPMLSALIAGTYEDEPESNATQVRQVPPALLLQMRQEQLQESNATQVRQVPPELLQQLRRENATQVMQVPPELLAQMRAEGMDPHGGATQVVKIPDGLLAHMRKEAERQDPAKLYAELDAARAAVWQADVETHDVREELLGFRATARRELMALRQEALALVEDIADARREHDQQMGELAQKSAQEAAALRAELRQVAASVAKEIDAYYVEIAGVLAEREQAIKARDEELSALQAKLRALEADAAALRAESALTTAADAAMVEAAERVRDENAQA
jgi:DNA-binding response OmpR family regulator